MTDSAILADMSVADIHFVPHGGELSSLGQCRLDRYVPMLKRYGGKLRYDSQITDNALITARMASLREFLEVAGVDPNEVRVVIDLPGGRGMDADEAIAATEASKSPGESDAQAGGLPSLFTGN
jgi:hypothetical protein